MTFSPFPLLVGLWQYFGSLGRPRRHDLLLQFHPVAPLLLQLNIQRIVQVPQLLKPAKMYHNEVRGFRSYVLITYFECSPLISALGSNTRPIPGCRVAPAPGTGVVVLEPTMLAARLPSSSRIVVESFSISMSRSSISRRFSWVTCSHLRTRHVVIVAVYDAII